MRVTDAICELAPGSPNLVSAIEPPNDLEEAVRAVASTGDRAAFDPLPPALMHNSPEAWAQVLYGGVRASHVEDAAYKPGGIESMPSISDLMGAAIIDINYRAYPVLVYGSKQLGGLKAHICDAPLAALEMALYEPTDAPTPLEVKWKGPEMAAAHATLRESTGAHLRDGGLACMPAYLLSKDPESYHLVRPGPISYLHMRSPKTDYELDLVEKALHGRLVHARDVEPAVPPTAQLRAMPGSDWRFTTTYERRRAPGTDKIGEVQYSDLAPIASKFARLPVVASIAAVLVNATHDQCRELAAQISSKQLETETHHKQPKTLSTLTGMTSNSVNIRRLGAANPTNSYGPASVIFAASDVGLAVRELTGADAMGMLVNLAKRVDETAAVMCIHLGSEGLEVRSIHLCNGCMDQELDIDSAARMLLQPWVTVVAVLETEAPNFVLLDVEGVPRDLLKVCDSVRKVYGLEAQRQVRPPPNPRVDFEELDKRLKTMEGVLQQMQGVARQATPSASAPLPPTITYTSPELERLRVAQKKWVAVLGKRPR